ncbi:choice-of-anchor B family protein, partial [Candidatus Amoebophilus asiaticus]|nr:choice-of-anchor B family protein [Candidatus Amoebophilus asiaticus]
LFLLLSTINGYSQKNVTFRDSLKYSTGLNDIWGYVDSLGNEYALVGVINGVSIVNVTAPDSVYEIFFVAGVSSTWRDLKAWNKHAYITTEGGGGLMIIDLTYLPDSISTSSYTGGGLNTAHDIYIDENGYAYVFGSNLSGGGAHILDLADPKNPVYVGEYNLAYLHDGYVRGDTLWGAEIYNGLFSIVDVSNKAAPVVLGTKTTPNAFTHNVWVSDDNQYAFTTDEQSGAYVAAFDVSDPANIQEVDRYRSSPGSGVIPHNTHVINDYLVNSYYKDGITIVDADRPANLIEVGNFDTSPLSGGGYEGCWGVYPFLPSGTVLATDRQEGLFVLTPNYIRGCYLEGTVTDVISGNTIQTATAIILPDSISDNTDNIGEYKTGTADSGYYNVNFSKTGYYPRTINGVKLSNGVLAILDVALIPDTVDTTCNTFANYSVTDSILCEGTSVYFDNTSKYFYTNQWLKDGVLAGTDSNLTITFYDSGSYVITLIVDKGYCQDTLQKTIIVNTIPLSAFSYIITNNTVDFVNNSIDANGYAWDFGDAVTDTTASPTHIYSDSGSYNVCLVSINGNCTDTICKIVDLNCVPPVANFGLTDSALTIIISDSSSDAFSYLWDFGDGTTDTSANPTHTYADGGSYMICLTVANPCGTDSVCTSFVCGLPVANFGYQQDTSAIPEKNITFSDSSAGATSYLWEFGDGSKDTTSNPQHTYADTGKYTVCLTVTNDCGSDISCKDIYIPLLIGISSIDNTQYFNIYPNPTTLKSIFIEAGTPIHSALNIKMYNTLGELIYSNALREGLLDKHKIDIADQPEGVYYLQLSSVDAVLTRKIILLND